MQDIKNTIEMQSKVQNFIEKKQLLSKKSTVIVGVSGGADSVALLHILHNAGYNCIAAHCNFKLRKGESDRDQEFVRLMAEEMMIPFQSIVFDTKEYAQSNRISIEMAARDLRYQWFSELQLKFNADAIAVAHHADDSIETLLMNLVRGTGIRGLSAIPVKNGNVIRPLLCCTRGEIIDYLMKFNLEYVEDSTNVLCDYNRNKFRNQIIPMLEEINPSVRRVLYETVERFQGIQLVFEKAIGEITAQISGHRSDGYYINIKELAKQADVQTVLFELIRPYGFHPDQISNIAHKIENEAGKSFYSATHRLITDREYLIITQIQDKKDEIYYIEKDDTELNANVHLKMKNISRSNDFVVSKSADCVHIDSANLKFPLILRHWREGDSFIPFGMKGRKKVSDFFIDNKLSLTLKEQTLLLTSGDDIVWILGYRIDNRYRVTEKTKEILEIRQIR